MNNGCGGWLISLCAGSNLPAEAHPAGHSTFQALCRFSSYRLSVLLYFWLPITEVCSVLNRKQFFALHIYDFCEHPCISMDYTMILTKGVMEIMIESVDLHSRVD